MVRCNNVFEVNFEEVVVNKISNSVKNKKKCDCKNSVIVHIVKLSNNLFRDWYVNCVSDIEFNNAASLLDVYPRRTL